MIKFLSPYRKKKLKKIAAKKVLISFLIFLSAATLTVLVILFAQGYHFSRQTGKIEKTGLLVLTSTPNGASIFINDHLTDATNTTIKLVPGTYQIRIEKEGYLAWQKELIIAEGLVTASDATLFPALPTLRPLTFFGATNPTLSPDGSKIAFLTDSGEKAGIWILNLSTQTLALIRNDLYQIAADTPQDRFSEGKISWAPNSRNLLVSFEKPKPEEPESEEPKTVYLLDSNLASDKQKPVDITLNLDLYQETWTTEKRNKEETLVSLLPGYLQKIATDSAASRWSSDEEKFLYQEEEAVKVYDPEWEEFPPPTDNQGQLIKDKKGKVFELPEALDYLWLPEAKSNHLVLVEDQQISIIEAEGTNKAIIFGGDFEDNFVAPWPDGSKLVILTSLNKAAGTPPNLYTINLR